MVRFIKAVAQKGTGFGEELTVCYGLNLVKHGTPLRLEKPSSQAVVKCEWVPIAEFNAFVKIAPIKREVQPSENRILLPAVGLVRLPVLLSEGLNGFFDGLVA